MASHRKRSFLPEGRAGELVRAAGQFAAIILVVLLTKIVAAEAY